MMNRKPDWPEALASEIEARRSRAFSWAEQDCASFAADIAQALTGQDPLSGHRGQYNDAASAARRIKDAGGMRNVLDLPEKPVGLAQRGDIVLADIDGRESFGVVVGGGMWCGPGEDGLVFRPMSDVLSAFEV